MINIEPQNPYIGLKKGERFSHQVKSSIGCIITCQAQSLCLISIYQTNHFIIFDSHSRQHNGRGYGACLLFFTSLADVCSYLQHLFPPIDQPNIARQSLEEQAQYAQLSVAQADYFCLKHVFPLTVTSSSTSSSSSSSQETNVKTLSTNHQTSHLSHSHSIAPPPLPALSPIPPGSLMTEYMKPLFDENGRLRERLHHLEDQFSNLKREFHEKLIEERGLNLQLKQEFHLFQERTTHLFQHQSTLIERLQHDIVSTRRDQLPRNQSPWCLVNEIDSRSSWEEEKNPLSSSPLQRKSVGQQNIPPLIQEARNSDKVTDDLTIHAMMRLDADLEYAQKLYEEEVRSEEKRKEEEKQLHEQILEEQRREEELQAEVMRLQIAENERKKELETMVAADALIAKEFLFRCCVCLDEEVDIEDKFDLDHLDHCVCRGCATSYIETAVKDRHLPIKCLYDNCEVILSEMKCFEVLQENLQRLYLEMSGRPTQDSQFRQCPKPNCIGFYLLDENTTSVYCECYHCHHYWCCQCQVDLESSQHHGISCEKYQEWKKENDSGDEAMEKFLRVGLNDLEGNDRMRRCPNCNTAYMKDQACNHVVCTGGCGVHFCFRCAKFSANSAQAIYTHQGSCRGYTGT
jgi:hypothetical protein